MPDDAMWWFTTDPNYAAMLAEWAGISDERIVTRTVLGMTVYALLHKAGGECLTKDDVDALSPGCMEGRHKIAIGNVWGPRGYVLRVETAYDDRHRVLRWVIESENDYTEAIIDIDQVRLLHGWLAAWLREHDKGGEE